MAFECQTGTIRKYEETAIKVGLFPYAGWLAYRALQQLNNTFLKSLTMHV